jgi:hypothetical protein
MELTSRTAIRITESWRWIEARNAELACRTALVASSDTTSEAFDEIVLVPRHQGLGHEPTHRGNCGSDRDKQSRARARVFEWNGTEKPVGSGGGTGGENAGKTERHRPALPIASQC